ncbi:TPA: hypothetical protein N0F65_009870 [Lagenidium giganteum]|uniref:Uncharacterized protein n=1 Tax=Lagenidium giganteum TaxID=4803 RepID=A0AAV2YVI8_9STRA|nr:TPA: hypothetical protein N0F65_009870 [Lagenidium giganteum]
MAKSDFVQGQKLKALINQEALNDASAASLANLFAQVMSKSRDYSYDKITQKLVKGAPKQPVRSNEAVGPRRGTKRSTESTIDDNYKLMEEVASAPTAASPTASAPTRSVEEALNDENFINHMKDIKKVYQKKIEKYIKFHKAFREKIFAHNREQATADEIKATAAKIAKDLLKRKRDLKPSAEPSPNLRPRNIPAQENRSRRMSEVQLQEDPEMAEVQGSATEDINRMLQAHFDRIVDQFRSNDRDELLHQVMSLYKSVILQRKGQRWFVETVPRINGKNTPQTMSIYKTRLKNWMKRVLKK